MLERTLLEYSDQPTLRDAVEFIADEELSATFKLHGATTISALADHLAVDSIEPVDMPCEGLLLPKRDGRYDIRVSVASPKSRQRFSVAHEFAHIILHKIEPLTRSIEQRTLFHVQGHRIEEAICNMLAAALLMPRRQVLAILDRESLSVAGIRRIAEAFDVSLSAAARRVSELGRTPDFALLHFSPCPRGFAVVRMMANFQSDPIKPPANVATSSDGMNTNTPTGRVWTGWAWLTDDNQRRSVHGEIEFKHSRTRPIGLFVTQDNPCKVRHADRVECWSDDERDNALLTTN